LVDIFPGVFATDDIVDLLGLQKFTIVVGFFDDDLIGAGFAFKAVHAFVFFVMVGDTRHHQ
jgi:hypothetical protein